MSHVVAVATVYRDLDALRVAVERLGGRLIEGQDRFRLYAGGKQPCLHTIVIEGREEGYQIGVRYAEATGPESGYQLWCDFFDGSLSKQFGANLSRLAEEYGAEVAMRELMTAGFQVTRIDAPSQTVRY